MKSIVLLAAGLMLTIVSFSQISLEQFNKDRTGITKSGMLVLSSWGAANILAGIIGQSSSDKETRYFHQMNLIWGAVNLAIAAPTFFSLKHAKSNLSLAETVKEQANIEKTFLFNAGLDLVYMSSGLYCIQRGSNDSKHDLYKGYGKSLILQGGGLLLLDVSMYLIHVQHGKKLYKILSSLQISGNSVGLMWKL